MMEKTDAQLIEEICRRKNRSSADVLVRRYYREIYAFLYKRCGNRNDAMDLTQDVFIAALRSLDTFRPKRASFRTWLYHIAFNRFIDHTRRITSIPLPAEEPEMHEDNDPVREFTERQLLEKIEEYVSRFEPAVQEIWFLHLYQEMTFRGIAELLHIKEENVKSKYYRLLKQIRKEFGNEYRGSD